MGDLAEVAVVSAERSFATDDGEAWLADLYRAHFGSVFRLCRSILWDREEAADAAHDVFARAAQTGAPLETETHTRAWLLLVARNHCIDLLRRNRRRDSALVKAGVSPEGADPEREIINRDVVKAVFAELSPRDRRLLWHSAVERRPLREIASELQLSYMGAAQALRRARLRAAAIAAKVAALLALLRSRRLTLLLPSANRALVLALVPAIAISIQSSVQAQPSASPPSAALAHPVVRIVLTASTAPLVSSPTLLSTPANTATPSSPSLGVAPAAEQLTNVINTLQQTTATHRRDAERAVRDLLGDVQSGTPSITIPPAPTAQSALKRLR